MFATKHRLWVPDIQTNNNVLTNDPQSSSDNCHYISMQYLPRRDLHLSLDGLFAQVTKIGDLVMMIQDILKLPHLPISDLMQKEKSQVCVPFTVAISFVLNQQYRIIRRKCIFRTQQVFANIHSLPTNWLIGRYTWYRMYLYSMFHIYLIFWHRSVTMIHCTCKCIGWACFVETTAVVYTGCWYAASLIR